MMNKSKNNRARFLIIAGLAVAAMSLSQAHAGSLTLGNSGWKAVWDNSWDGVLDLAVDSVSDNSVYIEKFVNFLPSHINESGAFINPAVIAFVRTDPDAKQYIILNDEVLVNQTGRDWTGFRFTLLNGWANFETSLSNVGNAGGFSIEPFTSHEFLLDNTLLEVSNGLLPSAPADHNIWFPGATSGSLVINTNGSDTFVLKEQPIAIPLPAAIWTGLSGLGALALIRTRRQPADD